MLGLYSDKEHSTIIFEAPAPSKPLLRLGWNKQDPRYMATIIMDATQVFTRFVTGYQKLMLTKFWVWIPFIAMFVRIASAASQK